jgi:hypothetical protein
MPLVPDQRPVEQLTAAGQSPSLHKCVHSWHLYTAEHDLDTGVLQHGVEKAGELAVAIADQETGSAAGIVKIRDEVSRSLCEPGCTGMSSCAQDPDPPGGMLGDRQHSVECSFVAVHRIRVTWESSQVRTACGRQCLPRSDST